MSGKVYSGTTYVIPCGGAKLTTAAPARELYTGSLFRHTLDSAERSAELDRAAGLEARVLILSGLHGLVELDTVLDPYEQRIDAAGAVTVETIAAQALTLGLDWGCGEVSALLPRAYFAKLDAALRTHDVYAQPVYEACTGGNGEQKRTNVNITRVAVTPARPFGTTDTQEGQMATDTTTTPDALAGYFTAMRDGRVATDAEYAAYRTALDVNRYEQETGEAVDAARYEQELLPGDPTYGTDVAVPEEGLPTFPGPQTGDEVDAAIAAWQAQTDGRREKTERNRAALGGKPGRYYDYLRGCWMFRHVDGTEERWERPA